MTALADRATVGNASEASSLGPQTAGAVSKASALGPAWRVQAQSAQESALPSGRVVVSCAASPGKGGLGRHLGEIVEALDRSGQPHVCISRADGKRAADGAPPLLGVPGLGAALAPVGRFSPALRLWKARVEFDAYAARQLPAADHLIAFNRQALAQFQAARRERYQSVALMSGSAHVRRVAERHAVAHRQYPLERSYGSHIAKRYLTEYEQADRIYVTSRYSWESFVEGGVAEEALSFFPLTPDPRYSPDAGPRTAPGFDGQHSTASGFDGQHSTTSGFDGQHSTTSGFDGQPPNAPGFEIVYVGSLAVAKGVPLLVDAVRRLPHQDLRLVLVGGWGTRGMRRYVQRTCAEDPRISAGAGDPLPRLRSARLCVHPSYTDGFCYGAAEALACGLPVIASEDTGMKDLIDPGRNGLVLPTGDLTALTEAIEAAYRGEIFDV
jgi:glycosyltransferase involved in cell wall biosynthesis